MRLRHVGRVVLRPPRVRLRVHPAAHRARLFVMAGKRERSVGGRREGRDAARSKSAAGWSLEPAAEGKAKKLKKVKKVLDLYTLYFVRSVII